MRIPAVLRPTAADRTLAATITALPATRSSAAVVPVPAPAEGSSRPAAAPQAEASAASVHALSARDRRLLPQAG